MFDLQRDGGIDLDFKPEEGDVEIRCSCTELDYMFSRREIPFQPSGSAARVAGCESEKNSGVVRVVGFGINVEQHPLVGT